MVTMQGSNVCPMNFQDMIDPKTNRTRIRVVDPKSDAYSVARRYMICLEEGDFTDPVSLARLSSAANISEDEFKRRYRSTVEPMRIPAPTPVAPPSVEPKLEEQVPEDAHSHG